MIDRPRARGAAARRRRRGRRRHRRVRRSRRSGSTGSPASGCPGRPAWAILFEGADVVAVETEGVTTEVVEPLQALARALRRLLRRSSSRRSPPPAALDRRPRRPRRPAAWSATSSSAACAATSRAGAVDCLGQRGHSWGRPDWDTIALARTRQRVARRRRRRDAHRRAPGEGQAPRRRGRRGVRRQRRRAGADRRAAALDDLRRRRAASATPASSCGRPATTRYPHRAAGEVRVRHDARPRARCGWTARSSRGGWRGAPASGATTCCARVVTQDRGGRLRLRRRADHAAVQRVRARAGGAGHPARVARQGDVGGDAGARREPAVPARARRADRARVPRRSSATRWRPRSAAPVEMAGFADRYWAQLSPNEAMIDYLRDAARPRPAARAADEQRQASGSRAGARCGTIDELFELVVDSRLRRHAQARAGDLRADARAARPARRGVRVRRRPRGQLRRRARARACTRCASRRRAGDRRASSARAQAQRERGDAGDDQRGAGGARRR